MSLYDQQGDLTHAAGGGPEPVAGVQGSDPQVNDQAAMYSDGQGSAGPERQGYPVQPPVYGGSYPAGQAPPVGQVPPVYGGSYPAGQTPPVGQVPPAYGASPFMPTVEELQDKRRRNPWSYVVAVAASCLATVFIMLIIFGAIGLPFDASATGQATGAAETVFGDQEIAEILQLLRDNYYHELSEEELREAVKAGLPGNLDSMHTYYIKPEDMELFRSSHESSYVGIGATIQESADSNKGIKIVDITPDSPAEQAGLQIGDIFLAIDGQKLDGKMTVTDLVNLVRGQAGSQVDVRIYRPHVNQELDFSLTRAEVKQEIVRSRMLSDRVGYLAISSFTDDVFSMFTDHMDRLVKAGAKEVVFDLRNNPGGSAQAVSDMLDYLLPEGTGFVTVAGREDGKAYTEEWRARKEAEVPSDMSYAILLNGSSASASELFSGCLRDQKKAVLIGEQSFGKGTGTIMVPLQDGGGLNITTFEYILPGGEHIEGKGLTPDQEVSLSPEQKMLPLTRLDPAEDSQLQAAYAALTKGEGLPDQVDLDGMSQDGEAELPAEAAEPSTEEEGETADNGRQFVPAAERAWARL